MEVSPVKLLYAMAFALFPLTIAAQTPDQALLTALCHDNHFEDPAGHCKSLASREDFTIEAILAAYGEIISSDADDESVFYLTDPGDTPVGAIPMRQITAPGSNPAGSNDNRPAAVGPARQWQRQWHRRRSRRLRPRARRPLLHLRLPRQHRQGLRRPPDPVRPHPAQARQGQLLIRLQPPR